jgi:hypothetical protein
MGKKTRRCRRGSVSVAGRGSDASFEAVSTGAASERLRLRREKYCHNGGMALRAQVGMGAVIAPFRPPLPSPSRSPKSLQIGLNLAQGAGVALLWGRRSTALAFHGGRKYCHNGGMASPPPRRPLAGVQPGDDGPSRRSPRNRSFAGETVRWSGVHSLWGRQWTRLPQAKQAADKPKAKLSGKGARSRRSKSASVNIRV